MCIRQNFVISMNKYMITERERNGKQKKNGEIKKQVRKNKETEKRK